MMDQNLTVLSATQNGTNVIDAYKGYSFYLNSDKSGQGTATASRGRDTYTGSWTSDGKSISFNYPTENAPALALWNQGWMIDNSGSTSDTNNGSQAIVLRSTNGNDMIQLAGPNYAGPR